jgi:hypothetical protein
MTFSPPKNRLRLRPAPRARLNDQCILSARRANASGSARTADVRCFTADAATVARIAPALADRDAGVHHEKRKNRRNPNNNRLESRNAMAPRSCAGRPDRPIKRHVGAAPPDDDRMAPRTLRRRNASMHCRSAGRAVNTRATSD